MESLNVPGAERDNPGMQKRKLTIPALILCAVAGTATASSQAAKDFNKALGRGINMGNMFEGPTEGAWASALTAADMRAVARRGFSSVRVPIRWDGKGDNKVKSYWRVLRTEPYTVDPRFFTRIDSVVSWARQSHLALVINDHHHDSLFANYENEVPRFLAIWQQIAARYKDLPDDSVAFEILNEPHDQVTAANWNWLADTALKIIRKDNPTRPVVIGTAEWGGMGAMPLLDLPDDSNLILTIHDYNPFTFTHQGASFVDPIIPVGAMWGGYWDVRQARDDVQRIADFAKSKDIPVWIGEFGAVPEADSQSRRNWAAGKARLYESRGFSWAWWELRSGFGIYDPSDSSWNEPMASALLSDDTAIIHLGEPPKPDADIAVNGDFIDSAKGWSLNLPKGKATFSVDSGSGLVVVDSASEGTSWGVQLIQSPVHLLAGHSYVLSFSAWADTNVSIDATVGMDYDPWSNYGSSNGLSIGRVPKSFFVGFQVSGEDTLARICFNVGSVNARIRIDSVKLYDYFPVVSVAHRAVHDHGIRQVGRNLFAVGATRPGVRNLVDFRGAVVATVDWVRTGGGWTANLASVPRNRALYLEKVGARVFVR